MKRHSREHVRAQSERHKARVRRKIKDTWMLRNSPDRNDELLAPDRIGVSESVHMCGCSCSVCGNPRKYYGDRTLDEIIFDQDADREERDLEEISI